MSESPWSRPDRVVVALVRHGQTAWNVERRFLGRTDIPLDATGEAQAKALGAWNPIPFSRVYSSPLSRAMATAQALSAQIHPLDDFMEMSQGELEGLLRHEVVARWPTLFDEFASEPIETATPGGESLRQTLNRVLPALHKLVAGHHPGEVIAVVSHQMVIASLTASIVGAELGRWRDYGLPNAAMTFLSWDGTRFELIAHGWRDASIEAVS